MVKAFNESHGKDVERLEWDRRHEVESKEAHALKNAPKDTVVFMKGLTSPVWTLDNMNSVRMWICGQISEHFQSGESLCHNWN
jgi:hypothetical protein